MNSLLPTRNECILFAILSSACSSVGTLFKVQGVQTVPPLLAASVGVLAGGLLMFGYSAARNRLPTAAAIRSIAAPLLILILLRPIVSNALFTVGLATSTGIKAVFLTKMEPYLVIFWVWMLDGIRPSGRHLGLLFIHVVGALMLAASGNTILGIPSSGDLLIMLSVVTAALSYRYAPKVTAVLSPTQTSAVAGTAGGLVLVPIALMVSPLAFGPAEQVGWMYVGIHTVLFYVLAISFWYASLGKIDGWLTSALRATGPVIAAPLAWIFFGETLTTTQLVGAMVVLVTSALISKGEKK